MFKAYIFICRLLAMMICSLWLFSCAPQPVVNQLPEFELAATVDKDECELKATFIEEMTGEYEVGFYYGLVGEDMKKCPAQWESSVTFTAHLTSLEYDTEYSYKAYVSNGYNEICSSTESFWTQAFQSKPVTGEDDSMILPFHTVTVGTMEGELIVDVGGGADFIVSIPPPGSNWVTYDKDGRTCKFFIYPNSELNDRECEVRFFNMANDGLDILTIYQPAVSLTESNLPFNDVEISSEATEVKMMLIEELYSGIRLMMDGNDPHQWMSLASRSDWKYLELFLEVDENLTTDERMCRWIITYDGFDSVLTIVQKGREEFFEFEDPIVGKVCVEAFDVDGDSRLSVDELSRIPYDGLDVLDFSGSDISSFEEMRFFLTVTEINGPVFAGTKLKKIRLPKNLRTLEDGVFKNCSYLQDMVWEDLVFASVGKEVFMGCKSLVWVDTHVVGESAFENCTSLAGVTQRTPEVPPYAFKNCKSLRLFEFNVNADGRHLIGKEAFLGCISLQEFTIPEDIIEIQDKAFYDCSSLYAVYMYPDNPPSLGEDVFTGARSDLKIHVPSQSVDLYKSSWPSLADRIVEGGF